MERKMQQNKPFLKLGILLAHCYGKFLNIICICCQHLVLREKPHQRCGFRSNSVN